MQIKDSFFYAINSLALRSLRSWLTIIGMVIGVIALVVILSVSEGFDRSVNDQLSAFGPNQLIIFPASSAQSAFSLSFSRPPTSGKLFQNDADSILSINGVKQLARSDYGRTSLSFKNKNITATIHPTRTNYYKSISYYR